MNNKVNSNHYQKADFLLGVHQLNQLPPDTGIEVAFAGRSNAGKSSALNAISGNKRLARTSKTPGRTQQINFFQIDTERHLVDLPGYGYAKVPLKVKQHWQHVLSQYLQTRNALQGVVIMVDIRRLLRDYDLIMLEWCEQRNLPVHILLTKADKLKRGPATAALHMLETQLHKDFPNHVTAQLFSAVTGAGLEQTRAKLDKWFGITNNTHTIQDH